MLDINEIKDRYLKLYDDLRSIIGYYDLYGNVVKLLFIKYISTYPDKLLVNNVEDYKKLMEFKRILDSARNGDVFITPTDMESVLSVVDSCLNNTNVRLFDIVHNMRYFFDKEQQQKILNVLDVAPMEADSDFIKYIFELLFKLTTNDVKMTAEKTTNASMRKLAVELLDVDETDSILNCYCGFSSLLLNLNKTNMYTGYDIDTNNVQISIMMALMLEQNKYSIYSHDFLLVEPEQQYSKVFADGPLGVKIQPFDIKNEFSSIRDIEVVEMYKVMNLLKDGGKAVFVVPAKILFSSGKGTKEFRMYFNKRGLRAIIALPPLWNNSTLPTNLIIIEKDYIGDITMINAKDCIKSTKKGILNDEDIQEIKSMYDSGETNNYCALVKRSDSRLLDTWVPTNYISNTSTKQYRDIEKIDLELNKLYEDLKNL